MRFMHISDLHIGYKFKNASFKAPHLFGKRSIELIDTFYKALNTAKTKALDFILLTGDLFDHAFVSPRLIDEVFNALSALNMPVYITVGNHDIFLQNQAYKKINTIDNLYFFSKENPVYTLGNVEIAGINTKDFSTQYLDEVTSKLTKGLTHILCMHGDVYNKQDDYFLISQKELKNLPYDYIALGHIHKHDFIAPHIAYSGNLEPFDFSETEPKGYILGEIDQNKFNFHSINKRSYHVKSITLTTEDSLKSIQDKVLKAFSQDEINKDFNRLVLKGRLNRFISLDDGALDAVKEPFYYLEIQNQTQKDYDLEQLKKAYKDTIIEILIDDFNPMKDDEEALTLALDELLKTEEGYL